VNLTICFRGSPKPCEQTRKAHVTHAGVELSCSRSLFLNLEISKARTKLTPVILICYYSFKS